MKKRIVLLVAAFLLSGDGFFNSTVFNSGLSNNGLSNGSLLLGGSAAWAQNDLGISKGKINKSLKRLEQLALIIRQIDESGVIGISAGMTGSTESTSSASTTAISADRTTSGSNIPSNGAHSSTGGTTNGSNIPSNDAHSSDGGTTNGSNIPSIGTHSSAGGTTSGITSSSNGNTTISSNGAALLMEVAGRCKELSGEILQNMGRVSTLGTLHSSSQKLQQRTLLLSKVDEIAKSLALHKSNLEALKSEAQGGRSPLSLNAAQGGKSAQAARRTQATANAAREKRAAQADKAAQARIAQLVAKAIGIMEQEYEFQVLATGCMASALGAMD